MNSGSVISCIHFKHGPPISGLDYSVFGKKKLLSLIMLNVLIFFFMFCAFTILFNNFSVACVFKFINIIIS